MSVIDFVYKEDFIEFKDLIQDNHIELMSYVEDINKYLILLFIITSVFTGFLVGYFLARKKV